ncbi:hypothetical protein FGO68_gene10484 [Halteria grandinella]|uniref:Uncharacterized protein n=1 Tax=Halteria grandinella TaxID=5974 RepID=A0A8J8T5L0_HALGN|nr:hypothetical protein FGO68_gene10484 [Halteria grandinella]
MCRFLETKVLKRGIFDLKQFVNLADVIDLIDIKMARKNHLFMIESFNICTSEDHFRSTKQVEYTLQLINEHFQPSSIHIELGDIDFNFQQIPHSARNRLKLTLGKDCTKMREAKDGEVLTIFEVDIAIRCSDCKILDKLFSRIIPLHTLNLDWPQPVMDTFGICLDKNNLENLNNLILNCKSMNSTDYEQFQNLGLLAYCSHHHIDKFVYEKNIQVRIDANKFPEGTSNIYQAMQAFVAIDCEHKCIQLPDKATAQLFSSIKTDMSQKSFAGGTAQNKTTRVLAITLNDRMNSKVTSEIIKWLLAMHPNIHTLFVQSDRHYNNVETNNLKKFTRTLAEKLFDSKYVSEGKLRVRLDIATHYPERVSEVLQVFDDLVSSIAPRIEDLIVDSRSGFRVLDKINFSTSLMHLVIESRDKHLPESFGYLRSAITSFPNLEKLSISDIVFGTIKHFEDIEVLLWNIPHLKVSFYPSKNASNLEWLFGNFPNLQSLELEIDLSSSLNYSTIIKDVLAGKQNAKIILPADSYDQAIKILQSAPNIELVKQNDWLRSKFPSDYDDNDYKGFKYNERFLPFRFYHKILYPKSTIFASHPLPSVLMEGVQPAIQQLKKSEKLRENFDKLAFPIINYYKDHPAYFEIWDSLDDECFEIQSVYEQRLKKFLRCQLCLLQAPSRNQFEDAIELHCSVWSQYGNHICEEILQSYDRFCEYFDRIRDVSNKQVDDSQVK